MCALGNQVSSAVVRATTGTATKERMCAIVVTYNPGSGLLSRLAALHSQVGEVIVVDNNSRSAVLEALRRTPAELNIALINNNENLGVATALNQGVSLAMEHGFDWALLLDQDTTPAIGIADHLVESCSDFPDPNKLAIVGSNYVNGTTGRVRWPRESFGALSWMERKIVITSGSLISLNAFQAIGPFRDEYFIDCVDQEYCLRARAKGFKVIVTREPLMTHDIGQPTLHRLLWRRVAAYNHAPIRKYYLVRNHIAMAKEYLFSEPSWTLASLGQLLALIIIWSLFEKQRLIKAKYMGLGLIDGLLSKFDRSLSDRHISVARIGSSR
jgi:rhamnosyltransferase